MPVYFSHTDRTLQQHLFGLKEVIDQIVPQKFQQFRKQEELVQILYQLISYHDIAKATPYFQYRIARAIQKENPKFFKKYREELEFWIHHPAVRDMSEEKIRKLSHHTLFGATVSQQQFVNDGLQLEHLILYEIIRRHHGDLKNFAHFHFTKAFLDDEEKDNFLLQFNAMDFDAYAELVKEITDMVSPRIDELKKRLGRQRKFSRCIEEVYSERSASHYLLTQFLYSLLLSADKGDVMLSEKDRILSRFNIPSDIIDRFKTTISSEKEIDRQREDAYQTVLKNLVKNLDKNFFSITLPTGLGKTFTAYKAALRLKEEDPNYRIIYCLPFTSIIDQNGQLLKKILKETNQSENLATLHHYLSAPQEKMKDNNEELMTYQEGEYLTEGWENEIIITTFVQLFESLFTNRNRVLRKFHNLVNSIIILDEVQNIPPKFVEVIEVVLEKMAEKFNTKFLFVTATQPMILPEKVFSLEVNMDKPDGYYFKGLDRIMLDQSLFQGGELDDNQIYEEIEKCAVENPDKSILIIINTKTFSQRLFEHINDSITHKCLYLSAGLIPYHRKKVIDYVKKTNKSLCLVSTQVVEAGVDIDFDIVYREFAPMDSINQAAGRCNRNGIKGKGIVKIFNYKRKSPLKIYDPVLIDSTRKVLESRGARIPENQLFILNREYFVQVKEKIQDENDTSKELLRYIYGLQFEKLKEKFKLIEKEYIEYNLFIPINEEAQEIWRKYVSCLEINNPFKRKAAIKKVKPQLLNFVVTVPDYAIEMTNEEKEKSIIKREDWEDIYHVEKGFLFPKDDQSSPKTFIAF